MGEEGVQGGMGGGSKTLKLDRVPDGEYGRGIRDIKSWRLSPCQPSPVLPGRGGADNPDVPCAVAGKTEKNGGRCPNGCRPRPFPGRGCPKRKGKGHGKERPSVLRECGGVERQGVGQDTGRRRVFHLGPRTGIGPLLPPVHAAGHGVGLLDKAAVGHSR